MAKEVRGPTYYEILGVPRGASIDHIKDSYRLLTMKTSATDAAYQALTDPTTRRDYDENLGEIDAMQSSTVQDEDYFAVSDEAGWHVIGDRDVGWELEALLPDRRIRLRPPNPIFVPFSKSEAEEFVERKRRGAVSELGTEGEPASKGGWTELGAPRDMPQKPSLTTPAELHYIAGIERMLRSGVHLHPLNTLLDFTPEQIFEVGGITIATKSDLDCYCQYVNWLCDFIDWFNSLPTELAANVAEKLGGLLEGRYRFLVSYLQSGGPTLG